MSVVKWFVIIIKNPLKLKRGPNDTPTSILILSLPYYTYFCLLHFLVATQITIYQFECKNLELRPSVVHKCFLGSTVPSMLIFSDVDQRDSH
jgi:hypothetical protein